jgi:hypothetical protein
MPFAFRFRCRTFILEFCSGVFDEFLEAFLKNSTDVPRSDADKLFNVAEKVLVIGAGGAVCAETGNLVNGGCSLLTKTSKGALAVSITAKLGEVLFSATPNLLV